MSDAIGMVMVSFCGAIMAVIGVALLLPAIRARSLVARARTWPSTPGTIVTSRVDEKTYANSVGDNRRTRRSYQTAIEYAFDAGGKRYTHSRVYFGARLATPSRAEAEAEAAKYPVGASVPVYFDPLDPAQSVLERRASKVAFYVGCGMLVVGATTIVLAIVAFV